MKKTKRPAKRVRKPTAKPRAARGPVSGSDGGIARRLRNARRGIWDAGMTTLQHASSAFPIGPTEVANVVQSGIKKLEDVFDQRVVGALERAGMPSASELRRLMLQMDGLMGQVKNIDKRLRGRKPTN